VSDAAKRGWTAFAKAKCTNCHVGFLLTDLQFHNVGIGLVDGKPKDVGRFANSKIEKDTGAFKTPTLRDIARTAAVLPRRKAWRRSRRPSVDGERRPRQSVPRQGQLLKAEITAAEQADIVEFLRR